MPTGGTVAGTSLSFSDFQFTDVAVSSVNAATLAGFDTLVLLQVNTNNLSPQQQADINDFVDSGHKLIIYDSDATQGVDYNWLLRPFSTYVSCPDCGYYGGTLTIVENSTLGSNDSSSAVYVNTAEIPPNTDAVGDANVMATSDPNWFGHMSATNARNQTGWTHAYAESPSGSGVIIYNGLDSDDIGRYYMYPSGIDWLAKIWYMELKQQWDPTGLPGTTPIAGEIALSPLSAVLFIGQTHTITASVTYSNGVAAPGVTVSFAVTGPNTRTGSAPTDDAGKAAFSYSGVLPGRDAIVASATVSGQPVDSNTVHADWIKLGVLPSAAFGGCKPFRDCSPDPVDTATGNYIYHHTDVDVPGRGGGLVFARAYNSLDTRDGPLGPGWTHSYYARLVDNSSTVDVIQWNGRTDNYVHSGTTYTPPPDIFDTLAKPDLPDGTAWVLTRTDYSKLGFDAAGKLKYFEDRNGNRTALTYDAGGNLISVADPAGRGSLTFGYDANGKLSTVGDWLAPPRQVRFEYDTNGRLWKVWDRENQPTTFTYDGTSSRLRTIVDARGQQAVENDYDPATGRVRWQRDAKGQQTDITYGTTVTPTVQTRPATSVDPTYQPTVQDYYDDQGRLTKVVHKPTATDAYTTTYAYDDAWNLASVTDAEGNTTNFCYDGHGNPTRRVDPPAKAGDSRAVSHFEYQGFDLIKTVSPKGVSMANPTDCAAAPTLDADGLYATANTYDTNHNLTQVERRYKEPGDPAVRAALARLEYTDPANPGLVTRVIPPRGNTGATPDYTYAITNAYGATGVTAGLLLTVTDALGNKTGFDYDAIGHRIKMVDANGNAPGADAADHTWEYVYDNEDRLRFAKAPAPEAGGAQLVTEFRYDAVGNREVVIGADGQVTKYAYDERDSLLRVLESPSAWTDPAVSPSLLITTEYQYDNAGNLSRVTRAKDDGTYERAVDYAYDGLNRLRHEVQYPDWPVTSTTLLTEYSYDAVGNRNMLRDPLGQATSFGYDALNRLTSVTYSDGQTPNVGYTYDADGNQVTMMDGTGTTTYAYDELSRPLTTTTPGPKTVGYRYDLDGNRTKVIYPDGTAVNYSFDKASRPESLLDWANRSTDYQYLPDGTLKSITYPNGTTAAYSYDNAQRLVEVWNRQGSNTISRHSYTMDAAGNRARADEVRPSLGVPGSGAGTGGVWAWGSNDYGELGDGTTTPSASPVQVRNLTGVTAVAAGSSHSLALTSDSAVWAWGANFFGQLGDGTTLTRTTPVRVSLSSTVTAIAAGYGHSLALRADGTIWAWGRNDYGQLGDGSSIDRATPVQVAGLSGVVAIAAGDNHSLAVTDDGGVWAWGLNSHGELGDGTGVIKRDRPVRARTPTGITAVAGGEWHSLALKGDGTVWAWGNDSFGQLGDGGGSGDNKRTAVQVSGLSGITSIAAGRRHSLAVKADGVVWAWGWNAYGQLGASTSENCSQEPCSSAPVQVTGLPTSTSVAAGDLHSLSSTGDGIGWGWGGNYVGQVGDGSRVDRPAPVPVRGLSGIANIAGRRDHSLAASVVPTITTTYTYDGLYRLTGVSGAADSSNYAYDPASNRLSMSRSVTTTYAYDRADRIQRAGSVLYTVDANGNLVARGADSFGYDQANRLVTAVVSGTISSYAYDGDGKRTSKTVSGMTTPFVYDVNRALPVVLDDGSRKYVWGVGLAYSAGTTGTVEVYYTDGLGSVRAIANANAEVVQTYQTDEFGVPTQTQGSSTQPFQYTGEQRDSETGLVYLRARMYDPEAGRFVGRDPVAGLPASPESLNRYVYALSNPVNLRDPSGLYVCEDPCVAFGASTDPICPPWGGPCIELPPIPDPGTIVRDLIDKISQARQRGGDDRPTKAECQKAIKLLTQYERLADKMSKDIASKIKELNRKRDAGTITSNDLPPSIGQQVPGRFRGKTLAEIRRECANAR